MENFLLSAIPLAFMFIFAVGVGYSKYDEYASYSKISLEPLWGVLLFLACAAWVVCFGIRNDTYGISNSFLDLTLFIIVLFSGVITGRKAKDRKDQKTPFSD